MMTGWLLSPHDACISLCSKAWVESVVLKSLKIATAMADAGIHSYLRRGTTDFVAAEHLALNLIPF